MNTTLLLRAWPYGALALLAAGLGLRCVMARRQSVATDLSEARDLFGGGRPWRASLVLLISGHIVALLAPAAILSWNAAPVRLYVLEAAAFLVGVTALGGCIRLIWHHLQCCRGTTAGQLADSVLLSLVLMTLVSGLLTALFYRWASSWGVSTLVPYVRSVVRFAPESQLAARLPFLVQVHLFCAFATLAILPFTRLGTLAVFGLTGAGRVVGDALAASMRPGLAVARGVWQRGKAGPEQFARVWREED